MKNDSIYTAASYASPDGVFGVPVNEFGHKVEKTKYEYPYSYDGFVTWRCGENNEASQTVYSDRLIEWDRDKYNKLSKKHFGNEGHTWFDRSPEEIQAFLRDWCDNSNIRLIFIMEYCNVSSGYPLWRFDYAI